MNSVPIVGEYNNLLTIFRQYNIYIYYTFDCNLTNKNELSYH